MSLSHHLRNWQLRLKVYIQKHKIHKKDKGLNHKLSSYRKPDMLGKLMGRLYITLSQGLHTVRLHSLSHKFLYSQKQSKEQDIIQHKDEQLRVDSR